MIEYIPLSVPSLKGNELQYVRKCIDTEWVSSAGEYVDLFEKKIATLTGSKYAIACVNGTSALQVSLRLSGVQPGDEVIIPSLTFIASVNAISYNGANPIFMDSDKYFNLDMGKVEDFITNHTVFRNGFSFNKTTNKKISAIMPVHVWGNACWLDELYDLCKSRNISIVEDAAESLGSYYHEGKFKSQHTGTIGQLGSLSFNGNKIITTGGGGMILTNISELARKAKYLTTQAKDDPINYVHNHVGYNFRLTNIQAALGVAQLEQLPRILKKKSQINQIYKEKVNEIEGLRISDSPSYAKNNNWMNILNISKKAYGITNIQLMDKLKSNQIESRPVWMLNHLQGPYKNCFSYKIENAFNLVKDNLCIPSSSNLSVDEQNKIIDVLKND